MQQLVCFRMSWAKISTIGFTQIFCMDTLDFKVNATYLNEVWT
jgi:hypothetical protein